MKKVVIIQRILPHYRKHFFEKLKQAASKKGVELVLIYGQGKKEEGAKSDDVDIAWGKKIINHYLPGNLVWQPVIKETITADLIIVEQANRLLVNYLLISVKKLFKYKIAYWGHGWCHQQNAGSLFNKIKKSYINKVDWWFAYTESVACWLYESGVQKNKVTVVQNAIDTDEIKTQKGLISDSELNACRKMHGIGTKDKVGIYCGGLYKEKQIPFLLEAAKKIGERKNNFRLIVIGGGPDEHLVKRAAGKNINIIYLGPKFGMEKVKYLTVADIMLMPGLVGLGILDSFALGLPIVTTNYPYHSPEISYLKNGANGIISNFDIDEYAEAVIELLDISAKHKEISENALKDSRKYTTENMVANFTDGIMAALKK